MAFSPETYALCQKNTSEQIGEALTSVYSYKGAVDTLDDLPLYGNKIGDVYDVRSEGGQNYGWDGEKWDSLGLNREATENDLGLIRTKDNTFNNTTFVGDLTAINSEKTSITGNGITSINGDGNFEVSKPLTVIASTTTNISGDAINETAKTINITGQNKINLTGPTEISGNSLILGRGDSNITFNGTAMTFTGPVFLNNSVTASNDVNLKKNLIIGSNNTVSSSATGNLSIGNFNTLQGSQNFIVGKNNNINNASDNIIGGYNNTIEDTVANSITIGYNNIEKYNNSILVGELLENSRSNQAIFGERNLIPATKDLLIIGNGYTDSDGNSIKQNAFTVNRDGEIYSGKRLDITKNILL